MVYVKRKASQFSIMETAVRQGYVLGPIIFNVYMAPLENIFLHYMVHVIIYIPVILSGTSTFLQTITLGLLRAHGCGSSKHQSL